MGPHGRLDNDDTARQPPAWKPLSGDGDNKLFEAYTSLEAYLSIELRDSRIAHVSKLSVCQALLTSIYDESKGCGRFHALMLAFRIRILPRKVRGIINGLLDRGDQTWKIVALSQERGRQTADQAPGAWGHVKHYLIVLAAVESEWAMLLESTHYSTRIKRCLTKGLGMGGEAGDRAEPGTRRGRDRAGPETEQSRWS
jgi:hypothetical protein